MSMFTNFFHGQNNINGKFTKQYYCIKPRHVKKRKCLDIAQDGPLKGTAMLWDGWGGPNQVWTIVQEGPDCYFVSQQGGYLTVEGNQNGARLYLAGKNPQAKFRIDEIKPGSKNHIVYTYCGKVLDCLEWGSENGSRISQYDFQGNGAKNQQWRFCEPQNVKSDSSSDYA